MSQELVVLSQSSDPNTVQTRTVLYAGDAGTADAVAGALLEVLTRNNVPVPNNGSGDQIRSIDRDVTDDDTIAPGDEVTPSSNIVVKAETQIPA